MHAGALGATTVTIGAPEGIAAITSLHPGTRHSYLSTASPEHMPYLRDAYHVRDTLSMTRMSLTSTRFVPVNSDVRRLRGRDANRINALYATEGGPSHYTSETIERAVYYGMFDGDRLVSVAGTHIVAPNQGIAIVGNVFTDAAYRGLGPTRASATSRARRWWRRGWNAGTCLGSGRRFGAAGRALVARPTARRSRP